MFTSTARPLRVAGDSAEILARAIHEQPSIPIVRLHNEYMWIGVEEEAPPYRKLSLRQVAGQVARRIVCDLRPGQTLERGEKIGMIKLGSRTELVLPAEGLQVAVKVGQHIHGGCDVIARYAGLTDARSGIRQNSENWA